MAYYLNNLQFNSEIQKLDHFFLSTPMKIPWNKSIFMSFTIKIIISIVPLRFSIQISASKLCVIIDGCTKCRLVKLQTKKNEKYDSMSRSTNRISSHLERILVLFCFCVCSILELVHGWSSTMIAEEKQLYSTTFRQSLAWHTQRKYQIK